MKTRDFKSTLSIVALVGALCGLASPATAVVYGIESCYDNSFCPGAVLSGGTGGPPSKLFRFNENGTGATDIGNIAIGATSINTDALAISQNFGLRAFEVGPESAPTPGTLALLGSALLGFGVIRRRSANSAV